MVQSLKHEIKYTFNQAKKLQQNHTQIIERIAARVYKSEKYSKIGTIGRATISGYIDANFANMYDLIEWVCWYKGKFRGLTKKFKYPKNYDQASMVCGYVYIGTQIKY
jgi:hypothetical protein